jgi:alpha-beta hydrolase superfamily lysophospholipase
MLEMLNPTGGDMLRFAGQVLKVRKQMNAAVKRDPLQAQALAAQLFCTPPESAKRLPDLARLKADSMRFFGWQAAQWRAHEAPLQQLLDAAQHSTVVHEGQRVHCYQWQPHSGKPVGRILLCHGWEGYALNFALLIQQARQAGYEVHAFDHLAHGRSEGALSGLPIALETLLSVAAHVQTTAGKIDLLVGHSLGGGAASWAVAHGAIQPTRLALIAPFYDTRKLSKQWAAAHFLSQDISTMLETELRASSGKSFEDFMPDALAQHYLKHKTPVLIVHDRADKITAFKHSARLSELASNVRLHEAQKVGHISVLADEACMQKIIHFAQT